MSPRLIPGVYVKVDGWACARLPIIFVGAGELQFIKDLTHPSAEWYFESYEHLYPRRLYPRSRRKKLQSAYHGSDAGYATHGSRPNRARHGIQFLSANRFRGLVSHDWQYTRPKTTRLYWKSVSLTERTISSHEQFLYQPYTLHR